MSAATGMSNVPDVVLDRSRRSHAWVAAFRSVPGIAGIVLMAIVIVLALMAVFGLTPYNPAHQDVSQALQAPSGSHWFGTDQFGRDTFSRVAAGLANSLLIAIVSVAAAASALAFASASWLAFSEASLSSTFCSSADACFRMRPSSACFACCS